MILKDDTIIARCLTKAYARTVVAALLIAENQPSDVAHYIKALQDSGI